jgi:hypothetical protein
MVETGKQLSVYLENKPSRLAHVTSMLAKEKINITAATIADSRGRSVLRFVSDNLRRSREVLEGISVPLEEQEVVLVEMRNQPGALAQVFGQLAEEHINIDYAYCSAGGKNGRTIGIFKVNNTPKALKVLAETPASKARRERHGARGWSRAGRREGSAE